MSYMELNQGTLRRIASKELSTLYAHAGLEPDPEDPYMSDLIGVLYYKELVDDYIAFGGNLYEVTYSIQAESADHGFADVEQTSEGYKYHTLHYNGGAGLSEVLEDAIEDLAAKKESS